MSQLPPHRGPQRPSSSSSGGQPSRGQVSRGASGQRAPAGRGGGPGARPAPRDVRPPHVATAPRPYLAEPRPQAAEHATLAGDEALAAAAKFAALGIAEGYVRALVLEGYREPTPIQVQAIPKVLSGADVLGYAQTGTGKTAAFVVPLLQRLEQSAERGKLRALVLSPTRELASQIQERAQAYGRFTNLRSGVVFGGVNQRPQEAMFRAGLDLLVATPGRLLDLIGQGVVQLRDVEIFVLDEADRMFDMGFIHDVRRVVAELTARKQTLMFSATMPAPIEELARKLLRQPEKVQIAPEKTSAETVAQVVYHVEQPHKRVLLQKLVRDGAFRRTIVFTRTKHGANRLAEHLTKAGIGALPIHGNKSQNAREKALLSFREGETPVLVATDVAARGIDIDGITHVINYDLPEVPETYVHRIGRTGRAGASGAAIAFCAPDERAMLRDIERLLRRQVPVEAANLPADLLAAQVPDAPRPPLPPRRNQRFGSAQGRRN
jgi:ATP-dependent RNA helicase RhlE